MQTDPLERVIKDRIAREGPIPFAAFMEMALYQPQLGYYMSTPVRFGPAGDFYTAPRLHPVFGQLLAVQLDEMRQMTGNPDRFTILEIGAGQGSLAGSIIGHLLEHMQWEDNWKYVIVEQNPLVLAEQEKKLKNYADLVEWKTALDQVEPFRGCVVTNELLDAFPIHLVCMAERFREIFVDVEENRFVEVVGDLSSARLAEYIENYRLPAVNAYRTEVNLAIYDYLCKVSRLLVEGFVLTIDYGYPARIYYAPERNRGTLLCYYRHSAAEDPYRRIGRQDISAHVNFTSLRDWGRTFHLQCLGYCTQGSFLASLGAEELASGPSAKERWSPRERLKIKNLLLDTGSSHQVMIQYKGRRTIGNLKGFTFSNRVDWL